MALEREKSKLILEKCQNILKELLQDEDNKYCVDCDAKSPRWASWNIGIFLCIRCAGIHRNLGVHISKVKSVNLDAWTPQQVACIQQMGNSRARAVYEANLQDNFRRPQTDSSLEQFIRAKYEAKKYIAREWVPPPMPNPTWDVEIEKMLKKKREKKSVGGGSTEFPASIKTSSSNPSVSPKPLPKAPGGRNSSPSQSKRASGSALAPTHSDKETCSKEKLNPGTVDLLSLDTQVTSNGTAEIDTDIFGDFLTAPVTSVLTDVASKEGKEHNQSEESSFFNQKLPEPSSEKLSKDSILALYSQASNIQQPMPQPQMYGGGMYIGGPAMPGIVPQPVLGMYSQQPQNMMLIQQGTGVGVIQPPMYSQGMPTMGGPVYPMMPPNFPQALTGVQLSAANPFAHVQTQMTNLSLSGMQSTHPQPKIPSAVLSGNTLVASTMPTTSHQSTLSNNLWQ